MIDVTAKNINLAKFPRLQESKIQIGFDEL